LTSVGVVPSFLTLWLLNDLGLVSTLGPRRESVRSDANLRRHHHYVCVRCGLARDFESTELDALRIPESVKGFGSIVVAHVEVRGVCDRCASEQNDDHPNEPSGKDRSEP
jgi:Fur family transcriptional regulator, peroxide stress response regulator